MRWADVNLSSKAEKDDMRCPSSSREVAEGRGMPPSFAFCFIQSFNRLDDAQSHWGAQSMLPSPPIQIHLGTLSQTHPETMFSLTPCGTPKLTHKINHPALLLLSGLLSLLWLASHILTSGFWQSPSPLPRHFALGFPMTHKFCKCHFLNDTYSHYIVYNYNLRHQFPLFPGILGPTKQCLISFP